MVTFNVTSTLLPTLSCHETSARISNNLSRCRFCCHVSPNCPWWMLVFGSSYWTHVWWEHLYTQIGSRFSNSTQSNTLIITTMSKVHVMREEQQMWRACLSITESRVILGFAKPHKYSSPSGFEWFLKKQTDVLGMRTTPFLWSSSNLPYFERDRNSILGFVAYVEN